jgi:ADP-heptose:LPS heptosyltransferase
MKLLNKIVIIQLTAIGDTLMCEPALFALRKAYPESEITFITSNSAHDILKHNPNIFRIIVWHKKTPLLRFLTLLLTLRRVKYDLLVDFQKNPRTFIMSHFIRSKIKLSFKSQRRNYIYSVLVKIPRLDKYVAFEKVRMISGYLPVDFQPQEPRIYITDEDRNKAKKIFIEMGFTTDDFIIAVSPVSKVRQRAWQAKNYSRLCDHLFEKYSVKFLFTWGPGEKHMVEEVTSGMKTHKPDTSYSIDSLKVLYAMFDLSDLFLGNNNGPRHMAIAASIPTMSIFGHFYYTYWTPPNTEKHCYVEPRQIEVGKNEFRIDSVSYEDAEITCGNLVSKLVEEPRKVRSL